MEEKKDIKELIERSSEYAVNGTAAVKVQTQPEYVPSHKQSQQQKTVRKVAPKTAQRPLPTAIKAEIISAVLFVAAIAIALMAMHSKVDQVSAENNAILRNIDSMQQEIEELNEEADKNVSMDDVYAVIESKGLVQNDANVNP